MKGRIGSGRAVSPPFDDCAWGRWEWLDKGPPLAQMMGLS
ncbi:hypothetical protein SFOMI_2967 [Sphingobium fuliginis]|uniref:Uncharacterized protein n=1 Tax=Sphingobium fuliginis (strain ATCC 27551) TaxID=336203 RepID=A0A292ZHL9_SPHSA|nr:hypothetical protein SFOMI_2967 [Sphingobium fuliginis]